MRITASILWSLCAVAATSFTAAEGGEPDPSFFEATTRGSGSRSLATTPTDGYHTRYCGDDSETACQDADGVFSAFHPAHDSEIHEVTCCTEVELPFFSSVNEVKNSGCDVYAFTQVPIDPATNGPSQCIAATTHWEAEAICSAHGARLCTAEEIIEGCIKYTPCPRLNVWTNRQACGTDEECLEKTHPDKRVGCYIDRSVTLRLDFDLGSPYSLDSCFETCKAGGYAYSGVHSAKYCKCGNTVLNFSPAGATGCNVPMTLGPGVSGNGRQIHVFATGLAPFEGSNYQDEYRRCVNDDDGVLTMISDRKSITGCVDACTNANYALAGLKNGKECWCGDQEPNVASVNCRTGCEDGPGFCGGERALSLYNTLNDKVPFKEMLGCRGQLANIWGDPHLVSYDNLKFDCQGVGHFTLTECQDYVVQGIFEHYHRSVAVTTGLVAQYKQYPKVQVMLTEQQGPFTVTMAGCFIDLYVGGEAVDTSLLSAHSPISITKNAKNFEIQFPEDGPAIRAKVQNARKCLLNIDFCLHQECIDAPKPVVGLLGSPNGNSVDDRMFSDGSVYKGENGKYCTAVWCIRDPSESLFTYPTGTGFAELDQCSDNPEAPVPVDVSNIPPDVAKVCDRLAVGDDAIRQACLIDVANVPDPLVVAKEIQENMNDVVIEPENKPRWRRGCGGRRKRVVLYDTDGVTGLVEQPIDVVAVNEVTGVTTIAWNKTAYDDMDVYVEYKDPGFQRKCGLRRRRSRVTNDNQLFNSFDVACPLDRSSVMVHLTMSESSLDSTGDAAKLSKCCGAIKDTRPKVKYTFLIPCEPCPLLAAQQAAEAAAKEAAKAAAAGDTAARKQRRLGA